MTAGKSLAFRAATTQYRPAGGPPYLYSRPRFRWGSFGGSDPPLRFIKKSRIACCNAAARYPLTVMAHASGFICRPSELEEERWRSLQHWWSPQL
jgi:hypothetical protein